MTKFKPILCLDFDGVLHSYTSGWQGVSVIPDPPVPGAVDFLHDASAAFKVAVYSSRSNSLRGRWAMQRYARKHFHYSLTFSPDHKQDWLDEELYWPWFKPPAMISIDDRALTFTGEWPSLETLQSFKPWNKQ